MIIHFLVVVAGLLVFEIIGSVDNAIINANILKTIPEKYKKIFLFWGLLLAVFCGSGRFTLFNRLDGQSGHFFFQGNKTSR